MSGNSFGLLYCVTSFGESHGPAYGGVVDGCPPGLELAEADIQKELDRRKPGKLAPRDAAPGVRPHRDPLRRFSRAGPPAPRSAFSSATRTSAARTTARSPTRFRPGTPTTRTGRNTGCATTAAAGRASARETAIRVAAGAIAQEMAARALRRSRCAGISRRSGRTGSRSSPGTRSIRIRSSRPIRRSCRSSRPSWTSCAHRATPAARA